MRAARFGARLAILSLLSAVLLAACSKFSIYDEFQPLSTASAQTVTSSSSSSGGGGTTTTTTPLTITPTVHGTLVGGTAYFSASGGTSPYTFAVLSGGAGGTINSTTGTYKAPNSSGTGTDTIQVTDSKGQTANATLTVVAAPPLTISPSALILNTSDTYTFTAAGGVPPYTYSLASGSGSITTGGIYTAPTTAGTTDTITVTDSLGATATTATGVSTVTVSTNASPTGTLTLSPAPSTVAENQTLTLVASGGTPNASSPYYNLSIQASKGSVGAINNSYEGTYNGSGFVGGPYTLKLADSTGTSGQFTQSITVVPAAPSNLSATAVSSTEVDLSWQNNSSANNDGIYVYRAVGNGSFGSTPVATVATGGTTFADTGLTTGTVYVYKIVAVASAVAVPPTAPFFNSGDSNYAVATTP